MDEKSTGTVDSLVHSVFETVRAQLASFSTGAHLAWAEVRVVAGHAGLFLGLIFVAAGILLVGWVLILLSGVFMLMSTGFTVVVALFCVFAVNAMAFFVVCLYMRHTLKQVSFKHTRKAMGIDTVELSRTK